MIRNGDLTVAAHVTGSAGAGVNPEAPDAKINMIYIADLDMISDQFFQIRRQYQDPTVRFDNVTFVLNCIDTLVGDPSLIDLRKRRPLLRKLTTVELAQQEFEDKWTAERDEAEQKASESLDAAQKRFDEAVRAIREDATLDAQAKEVKIVRVQQQENRKLDLEKAQIEDQKRRRLEEAQHDRDSARKGIHDFYRITTLILAAVPGILLGLLTYFRRNARAAAIVPASRQVQTGGN